MKKILGSQNWQGIGVLVTLIALGAAIYGIYQQQKEKTELAYGLVAQSSLLTRTGLEHSDKIKILYEGREVRDIQLYVIRIENTGDKPIRIPADFTDYERPINLSFGENATILYPNVTEVSPDNLRISTRVENNLVVINPVLLNKGNWFTVEVFVSGAEPLAVDAWLEGVDKVKKVKFTPEEDSSIFLILSALPSLMVIGMTLYIVYHYFRYVRPLAKLQAELQAKLQAELENMQTLLEAQNQLHAQKQAVTEELKGATRES